MVVEGGAVEVAVKQLLEEVDVSILCVEYGLSVKVFLNDFLATVGADAQPDRCDFIAVVVLHIT